MTDARELNRAKPQAISERDFQDRVVTQAKLSGWLVYHTHDSRHSAAGFPDLVMIRGNILIAAELKVGNNKPTEAQLKWLKAFAGVGHPSHTVHAFLWKPSDQAEIDEVLARRTKVL
jgi:hypothetical protein